VGLPTRFPKLRADPTLSRAQDAIDPILRGQGQALSQTPLMGAMPTWTPFPFVAAFANFGSPLATAAYYLDGFNIVRAKGVLTCAGGAGAGTTIGTFPMGYRPAQTQRKAVEGSGATVQFVNIAATGIVTNEVAIGAGGSIDFDFTFLAEQ
jgi:hypothetical protein